MSKILPTPAISGLKISAESEARVSTKCCIPNCFSPVTILNPVFFIIDYYREEDESPLVLVDIRPTHVDKYLDFINLNKYIK